MSFGYKSVDNAYWHGSVQKWEKIKFQISNFILSILKLYNDDISCKCKRDEFSLFIYQCYIIFCKYSFFLIVHTLKMHKFVSQY